MTDAQRHPTGAQRKFFDAHVTQLTEVPEPSSETVLVLKTERGQSVNIRGPFRLAKYTFDDKGEETVIDVAWTHLATESEAHLHVSDWTLVRYYRLKRANQAVIDQVGLHWKLELLESDGFKANPLFWFYLRNEGHPAYQRLSGSLDKVLPI
jgi:hypothetical protein